MTTGIAQIHARVTKGHVIVLGMGQTPRGQRYIKNSETLSATSFEDKNFKAELATAVEKLLPQGPSPGP